MLAKIVFFVPWLIGATLCGAAGIAAGLFLIIAVADWIINRLILRYYIYSDFIRLVRASATKRRSNAEKNS